MTPLGVMFPGQGTQRTGMGRLAERSAPEVFDLGSEVLGRNLRDLCFRCPARELVLTQNAQVAVFTCNAASAEALRAEGHRPVLAVGHSVGELNALCEAGVMSLEEGFRLVATRGELMGRVRTAGTMAAIVGLGSAAVERICAEVRERTCVVAALFNGPVNTVVSGTVEGVEECARIALREGARKVTRLEVSSAFHSPLMAEVAGEWRAVVERLKLRAPCIPVVLNATGAACDDADEIRRALVAQLTEPVRWVAAVRSATRLGVRTLVEAGDSKVLSALVRAITPQVACVPMQDPRALARLRGRRAREPEEHGELEVHGACQLGGRSGASAAATAQMFTSRLAPGSQPLTLVLLPALFVGNWLWDATWRELNDAGWPVITFAESISLIDRHTARSIGRITASLLRECRRHTSGPLVVAGDSLGGLIALEFAKSFPADTHGIVVSGAPGLNMNVTNFAVELGKGAKDADEFADRFVRKLLYDPSRHAIDEARYRAVVAELSQPESLASMLSGLHAIRSYDVRRLLPTLRCRMLFVWGRQDEITPVGPWEEIVPQLGLARIAVFDECGHAPMFEAPGSYNAEALKFLQDCAASLREART